MTEADSANSTSPANHRGLLALVIILGGLLLLAFGALVGGVLLGAGPGGRAPGEAYLTSIPAPADARITQTELDGNRLLIRVDDGRIDGGGQAVIVIEATTGRVIGRVELDHAP